MRLLQYAYECRIDIPATCDDETPHPDDVGVLITRQKLKQLHGGHRRLFLDSIPQLKSAAFLE